MAGILDERLKIDPVSILSAVRDGPPAEVLRDIYAGRFDVHAEYVRRISEEAVRLGIPAAYMDAFARGDLYGTDTAVLIPHRAKR